MPEHPQMYHQVLRALGGNYFNIEHKWTRNMQRQRVLEQLVAIHEDVFAAAKNWWLMERMRANNNEIALFWRQGI